MYSEERDSTDRVKVHKLFISGVVCFTVICTRREEGTVRKRTVQGQST